ncbi:MAG: Do family serine endopeptidase [Candidatus Kryptoniota bacterium]
MAEIIKRKLIYGFGALAVIAFVFALTMGLSFGKFGSSAKDVKLGATDPPIAQLPPAVEQLSNAFITVAHAVTPAVVQIRVTSTPKAVNVPNGQNAPDNTFKFFFGPDFPFHNFNMPSPQPTPEKALGSGVIVNPDGYIITNNHVVQDADHDGIKVTLLDKRTFDAKLIGRDPTTDIAVIKINGSNLPVASLGNSDSVHVGEWVVAIGDPMELDYTVTQGIISALGRNINIIRNQYGIEDFIQTDAVINPGNSGGPLVDLHGEVVGINTAIATNTGTYEGYGFAIPINLAHKVALDLIDHGKVIRPYIGVQIQDIDQTMAKALGMNDARGVLVQSIQDNSPAEEADIKAGDVILKFAGQKIEHANQLQSLVASKSPGDKVDVEILHDGKTEQKVVTLKERNGEEFASNDNESGSTATTLQSLGLSVQDADRATLDKYDAKHGVLVTAVSSSSEAEGRGLQQGDLITSIDNKPVNSASEVEKIVSEHKAGDALLFRIITSNKVNAYLALEIPEK